MAQAQVDLDPEARMVLSIEGTWAIGKVPNAGELMASISLSSKPAELVFATSSLDRYDSSLVVFLLEWLDWAREKEIPVQLAGLPLGLQRLLALARAVPPRGDRSGKTDQGLLNRIGKHFLLLVDNALDSFTFLGELTLSLGRLVRGDAQFRARDLGLMIQSCGVEALPIVSVISLLVGTIVAFLGAVQLQAFGAQIFVADMVAVGMFREMGALMTAIIMAGRTGASFAAQLGTMQVNQEVDALSTAGIDPIDFLVLPRMLALILMMPLLVMYANFLGLLGGLVIGVTMLDISPQAFLLQASGALGLSSILIGMFKSVLFGVLIAFSGCLRGIRCGRSASAVGDATTAAVVSAIVYIIVADAVVAILTMSTGF